MSTKENSSVEFYTEKKVSSKAESHEKNDFDRIIRKSYRITLTKWSPVKIRVDSSNFDVVNISAKGLAIRIDKPEVFSIGQKLADLKLNLEGTYLTLEGKVNHISADNYGNYLCGIDLINLDKYTAEVLQKYVQQNRSEIFG